MENFRYYFRVTLFNRSQKIENDYFGLNISIEKEAGNVLDIATKKVVEEAIGSNDN